MGVGSPITLTATILGPMHGAPIAWSLASGTRTATIRTQFDDSAVFQASRPGTYSVTATGAGMVGHVSLHVYGVPAAVVVTPTTSHLVSDGQATDALHLSVVDRQGTQVSGFVGTVELTDQWGRLCQGGAANHQLWVPINEGQGTATLCAPGLPMTQDDRVATNHLKAEGVPAYDPVAHIHYGTTSVQAIPATATTLALTPVWGGERRLVASNKGIRGLGPTYLSANPVQAVTLRLAIQDTAGNPIFAPQNVAVQVQGPGSLAPNTSVTTKILHWPIQAMVTLYSRKNDPGSITVSATTPGLAPVHFSARSILSGVPAHFRVLVSRAIDNAGIPYNFYDVQLIAGHGQPLPNATGSIAVQDDSATLFTSDPLAVQFGRSAASVLYAPAGNVRQAHAYRPGPIKGPIVFPLVHGSAQFALETGAGAETPARLTISDPALGLHLQPLYFWATGQPAQAVVSATANGWITHCGLGTCQLITTPGHPVTVFAQVTDAHGNPLAQAGLPILFSLSSSAGHFTSSTGTTEWALTNAQGVASVTVIAPRAGIPVLTLMASFDQHIGVGGNLLLLEKASA